MKHRAKINKIIFLLIVTIIPLLAAFFIGQYSYNRYKGEYIYNYMNDIEEVTEAKIDGYLKMFTNSFDNEPVYSKNVEHDGGPVFKIEIFRGTITKIDTDTKEEYLELQYYVALYDINYQKIIDIEDPTGEKKLMYNNIPQIYIRITDANDSSNEIIDTMKSTSSKALIRDYNSSPEEDYRGNPLSAMFVRWLEITPSKDFSNEVEVELYMTDDANASNATYHSTITTFNLANFETDIEDINLTTFEVGYEQDVVAAGYFGYIFKTKIWWHSLIAFVLVGLISFSFYAVWTYEEKMKKETVNKKK